MYEDCKVYKIFDKKMKRYLAHLYYSNDDRHTISWAKYVWETKNNSAVPQGMVVDHVDNNCLNDDYENLQLLTDAENLKKMNALYPVTFFTFPCFRCGKEKKVRTGNNPFKKGAKRGYCSRKCMGLSYRGL